MSKRMREMLRTAWNKIVNCPQLITRSALAIAGVLAIAVTVWAVEPPWLFSSGADYTLSSSVALEVTGFQER